MPWFFKTIQLPSQSVLYRCSILYFSLPYFIFFVGWLRWYYYLPCCLFLLYGLIQFYGQTHQIPQKPTESIRLGKLSVGLILLAGWLWGSGVGAYAFQNGDYVKHTAVLYDLIRHDWPVAYEASTALGSRIHLVYYLAYYLPAALIGKLFASIYVAHMAIFIWTFIGLVLLMFWIWRHMNAAKLRWLVIFILFSGLDFWGHILVKGTFPTGGQHLEWWAKIWQFSAPTSLLYWVPQHALPGWILTCLFLSDYKRDDARYMFLYANLAILWSPFVALGLLVFSLFSCFQMKSKSFVSITNLGVSFMLGSICSIFLFSKLPDIYSSWVIRRGTNAWLHYGLTFLLLEIGLYALLICDSYKNLSQAKDRLFWFCLVSLICLLAYRYGMYNDLAMRASIPALTIFVFYTLNVWKKSDKLWLKKALMIVWVLGSFNAVQEIARVFVYHRPYIISDKNVLEMKSGFVRQYIARKDSFFFENLAKKSQTNLVNIHHEVNQLLRKNKLLSP